MRRRLISIVLVLAVAAGLTVLERSRNARQEERLLGAVVRMCLELRADPSRPIPVADAIIAEPLQGALAKALEESPDDAVIEVQVAVGGRLPATHQATVMAGDRVLIVLGVAERDGAMVVTGFEQP